MTTADNHNHQKDENKDQDIWSQPLSRANAKEAFSVFLAEFGVQFIFYVMLALVSTTIGTMIWVSAWFGVLLVPFAMMTYYLFKKYKK